MLGRFLELSLATPDIQASLDFYAKLGFSQAEVGDAWAHPYAVVTDGRISLGLHQQAMPAPSMTFVKPDLLKHLSVLKSWGWNSNSGTWAMMCSTRWAGSIRRDS